MKNPIFHRFIDKCWWKNRQINFQEKKDFLIYWAKQACIIKVFIYSVSLALLGGNIQNFSYNSWLIRPIPHFELPLETIRTSPHPGRFRQVKWYIIQARLTWLPPSQHCFSSVPAAPRTNSPSINPTRSVKERCLIELCDT